MTEATTTTKPSSDDEYANKWLDCAMCGAGQAFMIDADDPALGYCRVEDKHWRIEPGPLNGPTASSHLPAYYDLLEAAKAAKTYLEPELVEPGRTVFWKLVAAIKRAEDGQ